MTFDSKHELASLVLPGFGFFGATGPSRLRLPIERPIDCVQLSIQSGRENFLNLAGVEFLDLDGKRLDLNDVASSARLSTIYGDAPSPDVLSLLVQGKAIHSALERVPRLVVTFVRPVEVGRIEIVNRGDQFAERARHLVLDAWHGTEEVLHYRNASRRSLVDAFDSLMKRLGEPADTELRSVNEVAIHAAETTRRIAAAIRAGRLECTQEELRALLPMYEKEPLASDSTLIIVGEAIARLVGESGGVNTTDLRDFQRILTSASRMRRAAKHASATLARAFGRTEDLVLAKHNVGYPKLLTEREEHKKVIHVVSEQLAAWSIPSILCYGTLLGAVRDKGFIPHDDDVDMLYFDDSADHEQMMANRAVVMQRFRDAGYRIWDSGMNFQVIPAGYGASVDLFPCYSAGGRTSLMMEKFRYREIPTEILLPTATIELYGETYLAPNDSERFLLERYGEGWRVADPFHEWPWPVDDAARWPRRERSRGLNAKRTLMVAWGQHVGHDGDTPPKNSPSLIKKALSLDYDAVELDIRLSQDGAFVLGHDDVVLGENGNGIRLSGTPADALATFSLGDYEGESNTIITLESALAMLGDRIAHLDPHMPVEKTDELRRAVERSGFDPEKIIFCGYGDEGVGALNVHFPESVILFKHYGSHAAIDDFVLDELVEKQVDGIMLYWPLHYEECGEFLQRLKARDLQVLFYVHGAWPARGETDRPEESLEKMVAAGVDYVTSTAAHVEPFKRLAARAA